MAEDKGALTNIQLTKAIDALSSKLDSFIEKATANINSSTQKDKVDSSSESTTHPYGLSDKEAGPSKGAVPSKKRKKSTAQNNSTQSKKLKPQEEEVPYLSLPEEDEMDRNVQELFEDTGSETGSDSNDDCEDIFTELSKEINNEEDKGPPIGENLKTCINAIWQKPLKKEKYKEKLKQYKIPRNVDVKVKKCNEEIWKNKMATKTKTNDLKFQKIQTALTKTSAALIQNIAVTKDFIDNNKEKYISRKLFKNHMETSIKNSLDAVTLLATASSYTDEIRRDSIADKLPSDIKNCINSTEPNHASDKLFGDQLTKKVSEWKKSMKSVDGRWSSQPKNWRELDRYERNSKNLYRPRKVQTGYHKGNRYQKKKKRDD